MRLLETYTDLMEKLQTLPDDIAALQLDLSAEKMALTEANKRLESREVEIIGQAGGWAALGKNDGDRKNNLAMLLNRDAQYQRWAGHKAESEAAVGRMNDQLAALERQYGAVCYAVRLHSALLQYLGSAGAPVTLPTPEVQFMFPTNTDAEAIGL